MTLLCYLLAIAINIFWFVMRGVLSFEVQMTIPMLTVVLVSVGAWVRVSHLNRKRAGRYLRTVLLAAFLYYLAIIADMLFFGGLFHLDRGWGGAVNLEPFHTIRSFLIHYRRTKSLTSLLNLLGNIVILVPLGVFVPLLFPFMRRFWRFIPCAALVAAGIEYLQWYTALGVADVDDSILNFAGAIGGYFVTRLCQIIWGFACKRRRPG